MTNRKEKNKRNHSISILIIATLLSCSALSHAQINNEVYYEYPNRESFLDADRLGRRVNYNGNADSLAKALTEPYENLYLKYKAIYSWIAYHVKYDFEGLENPSILVTAPIRVLDSLKTVCAGYANLMCLLCKKADLPCEIVSGWARTSEVDFNGINWLKPDHAWNAIKINGEWRYCDATWGAGYGITKKDKKAFIPHFTSAFFNMSAQKAFLQHYPEEIRWLNEAGRSKTDFENQPIYHRSYFTQYIIEINQTSNYIKRNLFGRVPVRIQSSLVIHSIGIDSSSKLFTKSEIDSVHKAKFNPSKNNHTVSIYVNGHQLVSYLNTK